MTSRPGGSLSTALVAAFAAAILLLVLVDTVSEASTLKEAARGAGQAELHHLLSLEQAVVATSIRTGSEEQLRDLFVELNLHPRVTRAILLDGQDAVIAATRRSLVDKTSSDALPLDEEPTLQPALEQARSSQEIQVVLGAEGRIMWGVCPVHVETEGLRSSRLGVIFVELDLDAVSQDQARALGSRGAVRLAVIVAIALLLWLFVHARVARRLSLLVDFTKRIGLEGYSAEADDAVKGEDEIGELTLALTEMVAQRRALEEDRERLETAFQQAADPAFICSREGVIRVVNAAVTRMYGLTAEQLLGQTPRIFKSDEHDPAFFAALWETVLAGEVWTGRILNTTAGGEARTFDVTITPVRDANGAVFEFYTTQRDVTRELDLERQLLQSQKLEAVGQLAGGIAHDFNNLLTVILGNADLLQVSSKDPLLEQIQMAAERAADLTRRLLEFGRKSVAQPRATDLRAVLQESASLLRPLLSANIELSIVHPESLWSVQVDPTQMQQVILNLAINARDAMPDGGQLTVEVKNAQLEGDELARPHSPAGDYVRLAVCDTGTGIAPEIRDTIFDPFFTTKAMGAGTGLGLSTVHGIVTTHGGRIEIDSAPGKGTCFQIYLPRVSEDDALPEEGETRSPAKPVSPERSLVLVVEDEPNVRKLVVAILEGSGYQVLAFPSAEEALALPSSKVDAVTLLLTDVMLTGMAGPELAKRLCDGRPGLLVLFMSGYTPEGIVHGGVLDDGVHLLGKPFGPDQLLDKVSEVLAGAVAAGTGSGSSARPPVHPVDRQG